MSTANPQAIDSTSCVETMMHTVNALVVLVVFAFVVVFTVFDTIKCRVSSLYYFIFGLIVVPAVWVAFLIKPTLGWMEIVMM